MSTQTALPELQEAIVTKLKADATLAGVNGLVTGIFDEGAVPENQAFPYVAIGDGIELPENTFGRRGYIPTMMLHIWSQYVGFKECYTILAQLNELLDQKPLTLATQTHIYTMYDQSQAMNDPDGITRHLAVRYKFMTQE